MLEIIKAMLMPAIIMAGLALVFGIAVVLVSHFLKMVKSKEVEEIEDLLAGINCGTCGTPSCEAFALALVKGDAKISDCRPTAKANKEKITTLLENLKK